MEIKIVEITMRQTLRRNAISPRSDGMVASLMYMFLVQQAFQMKRTRSIYCTGQLWSGLQPYDSQKCLGPGTRNKHGRHADLTVMGATLDKTRFFGRSYSVM